MKFKKNKKGFTLVELIVVIAILAILASVATVATIAILNNSRKTPVTEGAASVKNAINNWYTGGFGNKKNNSFAVSGTDGAAGTSNSLGDAIKSYIPEYVIKTENAKVKPTNDEIWVSCSTTAPLTDATGVKVYVCSQYYYVEITFDVVEGACTNISVGDAQKQ